MITNLLGCSGKLKDITVTIRGIYRRKGYVKTILVDDNGKIYSSIPIEQITLNVNKYSIILYWRVEQKIKAIKVLRDIVSMDLRAAKDHVESHPSGVPIKDKLTQDEAVEIQRQIAAAGMECSMRSF